MSKYTFIENLITQPTRPLPGEVQIYTYHFPDKKIYIGYTSYNLDIAYKDDKFCEASPVCQYLNNPETDRKPNPEGKKIMLDDIYGDEIYKHQKKILDNYHVDTTQILNKNLKLFI